MNPNRASEASNKTQAKSYSASGFPFQSKIMSKVSEVVEKVENGTQTIRQSSLQRLSAVMHDFANKLDELNKNLDLNTPTRERALASSKKREAHAKEFKDVDTQDGIQKNSVKKDPTSEQSPKAPADSGAV